MGSHAITTLDPPVTALPVPVIGRSSRLPPAPGRRSGRPPDPLLRPHAAKRDGARRSEPPRAGLCARHDLGLAFQPDGKRHLFIGPGGGSLPKWVHRRFPRAEVDVAELDPEVVRVARRFFAVPDDPRLRPGGALVLNLIGALDGPGSRLNRSVLRTLQAVYPEVYTIPVTRPGLVDRLGLRSDARTRNLILVAPREGRGWTRADLLAAADGLIAVGRMPLEARAFAAGLLEGGPSPDGVPILLDEHAPVDDLLHFWKPLKCRHSRRTWPTA